MIINDKTSESQFFTLLVGYYFGYVIIHKNKISMDKFHEHTPSMFNKHGKQLLLDSSRNMLETLPALKAYGTLIIYVYIDNKYVEFDYTERHSNSQINIIEIFDNDIITSN